MFGFFSSRTEKPKKEEKKTVLNTLQNNEEDDDLVAEVDENERWYQEEWSSSFLRDGDPAPFVCTTMQSDSFPDPPVAEGWKYSGDWHPDTGIFGSSDGWMYAISFKNLDSGAVIDPSNPNQLKAALVRRRRWIRRVVPDESILSSVSPVGTGSTEGGDEIYDHGSEYSASIGDFAGSVNGDFEMEVASEIGESYSEDLASDSVHVEGASGYSSAWMYSTTGPRGGPTRSSAVAEVGFSGMGTSPPRRSSKTPTARKSVFGFGFSSDGDPALVVKDHGLKSINNQIKLLEDSCKKADEDFMKDFKKNKQPILKGQIAYLQATCSILEKKIETEVHKGLQYINAFEDELKDATEKMEQLKKEYFFPTSQIVLGQGGVYCALEDVWLEQAAGYFVLDLVSSNREKPMISLILSGSKNNSDSGLSAKVKLEGLKLAGDNGKGVPKLQFDSVSVTLVIKAHIQLTFNLMSLKWEAKTFQIQILSFKGPYGISKGVVSMILSLVTPTIRGLLLKNLPPELGQWIRTLPCTFGLKGEFEFAGISIDQLMVPFGQSELFSDLCFYNDTQIQMLIAFQKSMERQKLFRTMADLISYRRQLIRHGPEWETIPILWDQAARIYSEKIISMMSERNPDDLPYPTISFMTIMNAADDVVRKKISADFKLTHVDGQLSLNSLMMYVHQVVHRTSIEAVEKSTTALQTARLRLLIDRIHAQYALGLDALKLISRNLDFASLKLKAALKAGPAGQLSVVVSDIFAQAPVLVNIRLAGEQKMGLLPLVPYLIGMKAEDNGDLIIDVNHASEEAVEVTRIAAENQDDAKEEEEKRMPRRRSTRSNSLAVMASAAEETRRLTEDYNSSNSTVGMHRQHQNRRLLADTMSGIPVGKTMHRILTVVASSPHISMIVDKAVSLKPGAELFSVVIGPKEKGWKPFGAENMADRADAEDAERTGGSVKQPSPESLVGCPILMQTAPGIKMMVEVPNTDISINLADLIRFVGAHFTDLAALKSFLEKRIATEILEEQLEVGKMIIDRLAKYLLVPGVELEVNLNGKIVTTGPEIMVAFETPEALLADDELQSPNATEDASVPLSESNLQQHSSSSNLAEMDEGRPRRGSLNDDSQTAGSSVASAEESTSSARAKPPGKKKITRSHPLCAIFLHAELILMDILEDGKAVEKSLKQAFDKSTAPTSPKPNSDM